MITPARLDYAADGTPKSAAYDDIYHSTEGGLAQARHVFLNGNRLPERWHAQQHFTILETGFGLGLSFLATWQAWRNDSQRCERLHFVSTELHPFTRENLAILHASWPELAALASELQAAWPPLTPGFHHLLLNDGRVTLTLLFGDATETLSQFTGQADALYLDGFAPQKNPQLWSTGLLDAVTRHAAPGATLASWCTAGEVRQALRALGWKLKKLPGYAHKWQMLTGTLGEENAQSQETNRDAIVIGAGIAGCSIAEALARRGWHISLIEKYSEAAQEASGNPAGLLHPMLAKDDNLAARFSRAAYLYSLRLLKRLGHANLPWQACGILQIAESVDDEVTQRASCEDFPADYVSWLDQDAASLRAGLPVSAGGWWFPHGAWVNPPALCRALLRSAGAGVTALYGHSVAQLRYAEGRWHALDDNGVSIASAAHLILANAYAAEHLLPDLTLTLRSIRGQLSYLPSGSFAAMQTALCGVGYAIRTDSDTSVIGASFVEDDTDTTLRAREHAENLKKLHQLLPEFECDQEIGLMSGRVSFRAASHDRMPLVGPLPHSALKEQHTLANLPRQVGLYAMLGFGARGLSWAPLSAELLAAQMNNESLPLEQSLVRMLDPARYQLKHIRRMANN